MPCVSVSCVHIFVYSSSCHVVYVRLPFSPYVSNCALFRMKPPLIWCHRYSTVRDKEMKKRKIFWWNNILWYASSKCKMWSLGRCFCITNGDDEGIKCDCIHKPSDRTVTTWPLNKLLNDKHMRHWAEKRAERERTNEQKKDCTAEILDLIANDSVLFVCVFGEIKTRCRTS